MGGIYIGTVPVGRFRRMSDTNQVPVLMSGRLRLRRHVESDLDAASAMWGDPEVVRHIGGKPFSRTEVWHRLLRYVGHWSLRPYGYWAITDGQTGDFLGEIGLADWQREGYGTLLDAPECGWVLARAAQRRGYALEALQTVLAWADENLASRTVCVIDIGNDASIRLAQCAGYGRVTADFAKAQTSLLFERPARTARTP